MQIRTFFEYVALQVAISVIQVLPIGMCASFCRWLSWLVSDVIKFRRKIIDDNILGVYPEMPVDERLHLSKEMWYHLFLMGCEIAQAPRKIHDSNWRNYVFIRDKVQMTNYLIDYRPLVAVSGHFGNFEMGGYVTGLLGMPSYTVARKMDNPYLDEFINRFRAHNGQFILPKEGSAPAIQEVMDSGGILTLLGDQHAGTKGCWIDFLGRPASCHKAVALFTLSGNAPMMVSYCKHTDKPLHFEIGCTGVADPLKMDDGLRDVKSLTQWYNDRLADAILECPEQFWWVHRRWKEKPVRKTKKRIEKEAKNASLDRPPSEQTQPNEPSSNQIGESKLKRPA
ncbi:MAG: lysophospholipid acyltransferase family protein [Mariniblastus sp.]